MYLLTDERPIGRVLLAVARNRYEANEIKKLFTGVYATSPVTIKIHRLKGDIGEYINEQVYQMRYPLTSRQSMPLAFKIQSEKRKQAKNISGTALDRRIKELTAKRSAPNDFTAS